MFEILSGFLALFYEIWPSYGGAIVLFTLAIMLLLSPLAVKSTRSMLRMQRLNPELKKLQAKHKGDREALNQEMMAFYKANNINPLASCMPMLLQFPVLIALYQVLQGLTRRSDGSGSNFDPEYLDTGTRLYEDLSGDNEMLSFGLDLSQSALAELQNDGLLVAIPYLLLIAVVAVTSWIQQKQVAGRNPSAASNPQQQMLTKVLPFIIVPFSFSFPAGLVVYFATSNLVRVGQQYLISHLEARHDAAPIVFPESTPAPKRVASGDGDKGTGGKTGGKATAGNGTKGGAPSKKAAISDGDGGRSPAGANRRVTPPGNGARTGNRGGASAGAARARNRKRKRK